MWATIISLGDDIYYATKSFGTINDITGTARQFDAIDLTYITATCPHVKPISARASWTQLAEIQPLYVEIAPQLDLAKLQLPVDIESCQQIAIVPKGLIESEYHDWATQILISEVTEKNVVLTASPRFGLTGEVLDPASLNIFWDELIQGAYGEVARAKGIFEIVDGRSFYFSFGVRIQVWRRGMREGIARSQEWAEIASRKKVIAPWVNLDKYGQASY